VIVYHGVFERFQKILLKLEMRQFFFFEKTHGQLAQGVERKTCNMGVIMATNLGKVLGAAGLQ
jgi:hypothetical protein